MHPLFAKHQATLAAATAATAARGWHSPYPESPSRRHHPPGARAAGEAAFAACLGRDFALDTAGPPRG